MQVNYPFSMDRDEVKQRLQLLTTYWSTNYGIAASWNGNSCEINGRVKGVKFAGTLQVQESSLTGEFNVGFLAEKLGGKAYVDRKLAEYLNPDNTIEQLRAR